MKRQYHAIIIGAGIMGSAAACELARRGKRVLLIDQFSPPHDHGSSHGETRVIREAYFEHPLYVPLIQRAYPLWRELEQRSGQPLLTITGGLMIGPEHGLVFSGAKRSAEQHGLPHEILNATQVNQRFPAFDCPQHLSAVYEPRAGMLFVERCHEAFLTAAQEAGADFRWNASLKQWSANDSGVDVMIDDQRIIADKLILAVGAWMPSLLNSIASPLSIERQVQHWFEPGDAKSVCAPERFPVHVWEYESGKYFYALPDAGSGVKTALHHQGSLTSPDDVDRAVNEREKQAMHELVRRHLPVLKSTPHRSTVCLYTNTPDGHFIIDRHPEHGNVILVSPCSGHGFKFAPTIGEIAADLATDHTPRFDISLFKADRF